MSLIAQALAEHPMPEAHSGQCSGSKFHSPTPLLVRQVRIGNGLVTLCPTCLANLRVYVHLMKATGGDLEWEVRREFGNRIRALGERALEPLTRWPG